MKHSRTVRPGRGPIPGTAVTQLQGPGSRTQWLGSIGSPAGQHQEPELATVQRQTGPWQGTAGASA